MGIIPMPSAFAKEKAMVITDEMTEESAFHKIRMARADYHLFGVRQRNRLIKEAKEQTFGSRKDRRCPSLSQNASEAMPTEHFRAFTCGFSSASVAHLLCTCTARGHSN